MSVADHLLPAEQDELLAVPAPKPPRCACGDSVPASTRSEAEAVRREFEASKGIRLDQAREVTYYACRDGAWHSVENSVASDCPCGRPAWASPLDRNRAARIVSAQDGAGRVRARGFTCRRGGFHWEWSGVRKRPSRTSPIAGVVGCGTSPKMLPRRSPSTTVPGTRRTRLSSSSAGALAGTCATGLHDRRCRSSTVARAARRPRPPWKNLSNRSSKSLRPSTRHNTRCATTGARTNPGTGPAT